MTINIPSDFDLNVFEVLIDALESDIPTGKNIIGSSGASLCARQQIISNLHNISSPINNKMLYGKVFETILQYPEVLSTLILAVNRKLGIDSTHQIIATQPQKMLEVRPDQFLRCTGDIYTNYYMIENKTTSIYTKEWVRELAPHQVAQLNTQLGVFEVDLGFILKVNTRAWMSSIKQTSEYWTKLWQDYGYFLPWRFDKEMFDDTIERVKFLFEKIDEEDFDVEGPTFDWECRYCNEECRKICGKEIYKCSATKCYKEICEFPHLLTNKFIDLPLCENCFKKENPHAKYLKYKYIDYKEIEKDI